MSKSTVKHYTKCILASNMIPGMYVCGMMPQASIHVTLPYLLERVANHGILTRRGI
jgi:hypothetical protein